MRFPCHTEIQLKSSSQSDNRPLTMLYVFLVRSRVLKALYSEHSPFNKYPLIICGHSLGAGCASILSIMLRPTFPLLKCFAYCPPGAVVDDKMAEFCEDFITAIVRQDDLSEYFNLGYVFCICLCFTTRLNCIMSLSLMSTYMHPS